MSNNEKSAMPSDGNQYTNFPPPPPGPPPAQSQSQQQPHHQPYGAAYSQPPQHDQSQPPLAHPDPLQSHPVNVQPQTFPPPPSQPPPPHQQDQHQQQPYSIPPYDPAHPVFAPPPTSATQTGGQHGASSGAATSQAYTTSSSGPSDGHLHTSTAATGEHKKSSWSERFSQLGQKAAAPINSIAHKLGSQSFLPETMDKECDKAALILKTFCKKGVYADPGAGQPPTSTDPKATESTGGIIDPTKEKPKNRVLVTIPPKVISRAVGLAIFTTLRAGFQVSGATGSGILIARLPDGSWGPPSGIQVHSVGGGFQIGLDIYDCVCVINSREALAAFTNTRVSLGSDLAVVAGPYGAGGAVDFGAAVDDRKDKTKKKSEKESGHQTGGATAAAAASDPASNQGLKPEDPKKSHRRSLSTSAFKPVFSYVKSRGFYAGIQVDGTVVVERKEANAAFYGTKVTVDQILKGQVPAQGPAGMWPIGSKILHEILRGAEAGTLQQQPDGIHDSQHSPVSHAAPGSTGGPYVSGGAGSGPTAPATGSYPSAPGGTGAAGPPGYVDDGVHRPEVGDHKYA